MRIDGEFLLRKMAPVGLDHSFFKGRGPGRHAVIEICIRLCARERARAVAVAHGRVFHNVVLVRGDRFALLPDRRAHCAVGMDGIAGPVAAGVGKVESAGKSAGDNFEAELAGQQLGVALDAFEITRAAVKQEEAGFFSVGAERESCFGSSGSYTTIPRSQSIPRTLMRKMSSVCRIGMSGMLKTSSVSLMHCSRETNSGGCQLLFSAFMSISNSSHNDLARKAAI